MEREQRMGGVKKHYRLRIIMPLLILALAGTFWIDLEVQAADKPPYRFGLAMPMTGGQALFGADQVQAALWAVEDINAKGGVGQDKRKLEAIVLDTQADPKLGISMANRLATVDKIPVFVTAWSSVVAAVAPVANREKVLCLSVGANSPKIAELGEYVYTTYPLSNVDITGIAQYAYNKMKKRTAAILYINNDTGLYAARLYEEVFKKEGGKIVTVQSYEPTATDYTAQLMQIKNANPDIIHLQGLVSDSPQVITQMRQLGIKQTVTSYQGLYNQKFLDQVGAAAGDIIIQSMAPDADFHPPVKGYLEKWKKEKGRLPYGQPYTQYVGDCPYIVKSLYEWVESKKLPLTGENMRQALLAVKTFDTPLVGKTVINANHTVDKPVYLIRVVNGKFTYMDTIKVEDIKK
ncbi:MAG: ABC transporter substrate-binding protein [Thermodesulfobacteriota bacterium]